jgi:transcriptional regulator with XRE-family HTH domain
MPGITGKRSKTSEGATQGTKSIYDRRKEKGGRWIARLRKAADLTQRQMAVLLDIDYYTMISQVETGAIRVPPEGYRKWAHALKADPIEFAIKALMYYDPFVYAAIYGEPTKEDLESLPMGKLPSGVNKSWKRLADGVVQKA